MLNNYYPKILILLALLLTEYARASDLGVNAVNEKMDTSSPSVIGRGEAQNKVDWAKLVFTGREQLLKESDNEADMDFKVSGFATWGVTHSNTRDADYHGDLTQPNGAGKSSPTMFGLDTKAGIQGTANIGKKFVATLQVVADHRSDNSYTPEIEWANLKYLITPDLYVRLGRVVAPVFMISDYRNVGYAMLMVRPPMDVYSLNPLKHLDGGDIGERFEIGEGTLSAQLTAGRKNQHQTKTGVPGEIKLSGTSTMASFVYDIGYTSYRLGIARNIAYISSSASDFYQNTVANIGPLIGYPPASANIKFAGGHTTLLDLGYSYDPGDIIIQGEYVVSRSESTMVQAQNAGYILAGYRKGKITPYVAYSKIESKQGAPRNAPACSPPNNMLPACGQYGLEAYIINIYDALSNVHVANTTASLGVRYDANKNLDIKVQFDRVSKPAGPTPNSGVFINYCQPSEGLCTNPAWGSTPHTVNLLTATVDFVF